MQELEDLDMDLKKQKDMNVSTQMNGTNMQHKSTPNTSEGATQETSEQLSLVKFPTSTSLLEDFLAKHLVSLENAGDLTTPEGLYFLRLLGFLPTKDQDILYSKTSKVYLVMTGAKLSRQYLGFSPTWGMSINGKFLTAKTSVSPRIGKECSLSEILEENVDQKYFLSRKLVMGFLNKGGGIRAEIRNSRKGGNKPDYNRKILETIVNRPLHYVGGIIGKRDKWLKDEKDNSRNFSQGQRVYATDGISSTLAGNAGGLGGKTGLYQIEKTMIRRLTPTECERLQGFPDGWTEGVSDTQRYKCLGNAVTTNVVTWIGNQITKTN